MPIKSLIRFIFAAFVSGSFAWGAAQYSLVGTVKSFSPQEVTLLLTDNKTILVVPRSEVKETQLREGQNLSVTLNQSAYEKGLKKKRKSVGANPS